MLQLALWIVMLLLTWFGTRGVARFLLATFRDNQFLHHGCGYLKRKRMLPFRIVSFPFYAGAAVLLYLAFSAFRTDAYLLTDMYYLGALALAAVGVSGVWPERCGKCWGDVLIISPALATKWRSKSEGQKLFDIAMHYHCLGDTRAERHAVKMLTQARAQGFDQSKCFGLQADCLLNAGMLPDAACSFRSALSHGPEEHLADLCMRKAESVEAVLDVGVEQGSPEMHIVLAQQFLQHALYDLARKHAKLAKDLRPEHDQEVTGLLNRIEAASPEPTPDGSKSWPDRNVWDAEMRARETQEQLKRHRGH